MAEKLGMLEQFLFGDWAERGAINRNAEELSAVGADLDALRTVVQRQVQEIMHLRAMVIGIVEILQAKVAPWSLASSRSCKRRSRWTKPSSSAPYARPTRS